VAAKETWSTALDLVEAEGGTPDQRTIFYTGMYHMLLAPTLFSDEDGEYTDSTGRCGAWLLVRTSTRIFSDWDIYRNTIQFLALRYPSRPVK
jgi:putative alpha-1,2-mannosidase